MDKPVTDQHGFTLLELMIAMAVLAIGMLAIISLHVTSIQENDNALEMTEANIANQSMIESILLTAYGNINNDSASSADGYTLVTSATSPDIPEGYTLEYRVTSLLDLDSDGTDDAKQIALRVRDKQGNIKSNLQFIKTRI